MTKECNRWIAEHKREVAKKIMLMRERDQFVEMLGKDPFTTKVGRRLAIDISDLVDEEVAEIRIVDFVIRRFEDRMRNIFDHYADVGTYEKASQKSKDAMTINHAELKIFIKDSGILSDGTLSMDDILTSFSEADRSKGADAKAIVAKVVRKRKKKTWVLIYACKCFYFGLLNVSVLTSTNLTFSLNSKGDLVLNFAEFLEFLVRLAQKTFPDNPFLGDAVQKFFETIVLPRCQSIAKSSRPGSARSHPASAARSSAARPSSAASRGGRTKGGVNAVPAASGSGDLHGGELLAQDIGKLRDLLGHRDDLDYEDDFE